MLNKEKHLKGVILFILRATVSRFSQHLVLYHGTIEYYFNLALCTIKAVFNNLLDVRLLNIEVCLMC